MSVSCIFFHEAPVQSDQNARKWPKMTHSWQKKYIYKYMLAQNDLWWYFWDKIAWVCSVSMKSLAKKVKWRLNTKVNWRLNTRTAPSFRAPAQVMRGMPEGLFLPPAAWRRPLFPLSGASWRDACEPGRCCWKRHGFLQPTWAVRGISVWKTRRWSKVWLQCLTIIDNG